MCRLKNIYLRGSVALTALSDSRTPPFNQTGLHMCYVHFTVSRKAGKTVCVHNLKFAYGVYFLMAQSVLIKKNILCVNNGAGMFFCVCAFLHIWSQTREEEHTL